MLDENGERGLAYAREMDARDELAAYRNRFVIADPHLIYMDGNSLGRLTLAARERAVETVEQEWGQGLIRGWNQGWYTAPQRVGDKIARLVGANPGEVLVCDSTSVNLFKLAVAALQAQTGRGRIVSDALNFPSDLYILQGCREVLGSRHEIVLAQPADGSGVEMSTLEALVDADTALVTLSQVTFKSGFLYDVEAVTKLAHRSGALALWDLSHSVGAVPVELERWGVDLAVGCTYKYLNGGPGAPAFLYVRKSLQERLRSPIWGWFGQQAPFAFGLEYQPAPGIERFLAGTPPVISLQVVEAALEPMLEAGIERIRRKSVQLSSYLIDLFDQVLHPLGFALGSPRDPARRGSHVSIRHAEGYRINRALIEEMDVLPDFREPDNIRLGLSPLYTTFSEVWETVDRIRRVVVERRYEKYPRERLAVT